MNVTFEKKDDLNAIISIAISPEDYQEELNNQFKTYRKKAKIPGFRPGQVPLGMVKKMIGKSVLFEEVNKLTSNALYDYLKEQNIDILGQPMTSAEKQSETDFDNYGDFTFHFDLGLAPAFELNISTKDKVERYAIALDEKEVETEIKNIRRQHGKLDSVDQAETENDSIELSLTEVEKGGEHKDGGIFEQTATVLPEVIKSKKIKKQLKGVTKDTVLDLDIFDLFNDNEMVIAQSLGIQQEEVAGLNKTFKGTVTDIKRVTPAELTEEFYQQVFGADTIKTEEEFKARISENLESYYKSEAERQLDAELNLLMIKKHQLSLPDDFLKRWLQDTKSDVYTAENIEEKYTEESDILRKQLIREKIAEQESVEVNDEDLNQTSFAYTAQMLRQYGLNNPDPSMIQNFEAKNREDKSYMLRIRDVVIEKKVLEKVKDMVTVKEKKIAVDKFYDAVKKFTDKK